MEVFSLNKFTKEERYNLVWYCEEATEKLGIEHKDYSQMSDENLYEEFLTLSKLTSSS